MNATYELAFAKRDTVANVDSAELHFQNAMQLVHEKIVASLDVATADGFSDQQLVEALKPFVDEIISEENIEVEESEKQRLLRELPQEMFGAGPLEVLLQDPKVSDILVNHCHEIFVEREGRLELSKAIFANNTHLVRIIQRLVTHVGRSIDESNPLVDARMEDGSRINAIIPPLALDGPKLSIRRFGNHNFDLAKLVESGALTIEMAQFLKAAVISRQSVLISGGTGSGKTTFLNALSSCIPNDQRIVTIEDSAELKLQHSHVARLETRPAGNEDVTEFNQRDLVKNALRMRPDRIIVGEVRGSEALDMLQAMNTGHEGSLTTVHANSALDAVSRLEMMVAMGGLELPISVVRAYICSGISIIVHLSRLQGGVRKVMRVAELVGSENGYELNELFAFRAQGLDANGRMTGSFATINQSICESKFEEYGLSLTEPNAQLSI